MSGKLIVIIPDIQYGVRGFCGDQVIDAQYQTFRGCHTLQVTIRHEKANWWDQHALSGMVGTKVDVSIGAGTITALWHDACDDPYRYGQDFYLADTWFESSFPKSFTDVTTYDLTFTGGTPSWTRPKAKQVKQ